MESFPEVIKTVARVVKVQEWEIQSDFLDPFYLHTLYQDRYIKAYKENH